jgi:hypothetical protein
MEQVVVIAGSGVLEKFSPVVFSLCEDTVCGKYSPGMTGFVKKNEATKKIHVCLFDVENKDRSLPFTVENAIKAEDQLLPVHEVMHVWFGEKVDDYAIQEPFCKSVSFVVSRIENGVGVCASFFNRRSAYPDLLMYDLCRAGMNQVRFSTILKNVTVAAAKKGTFLTNDEFAAVVSDQLGSNSVTAFRTAGLIK